MAQVKTQQHYVWKHYLSAWALDDKVWCRRGDDVFRSNTKNLAVERDFYKINPLTPSDIELVTMIARSASARLPWVHLDLITTIGTFINTHAQFEAAGIRSAKTDELFRIAMQNMAEDGHQKVETDSLPDLASLRREDMSFLQNAERRARFAYFLGMQFSRTPAAASSIERHIRTTLPEFKIDNCRTLVCPMFGAEIGWSLFAGWEQLRVTMLHAAPTASFVASDRVLVNLKALTTTSDENDELELYYPISPEVAMIFAQNDPTPGLWKRTLTVPETLGFNGLMARQSGRQIYAAFKSALENLPL